METIGIFEAKTRLSEVCEQVAATHRPVTVTKRGRPLVRIDPIDSAVMTIRERRDDYMANEGRGESADDQDFAPPGRASEVSDFSIEG